MRTLISLFLFSFVCLAQTDDKRVTTLESAFGSISTERRSYHPLELIRIEARARKNADKECRIQVADSSQRVYFDQTLPVIAGRAVAEVQVSGALGAQYVYLWWPGEKKYSRYLNFNVDIESGIKTGDRDFDQLLPYTRDSMLLGRRDYRTPKGWFTGYISADTLRFDGIWLRDWIYSLPGYEHWEHRMLEGLDRFLDEQNPKGMIPDGIRRDGTTWRVGLESDVEYIMVLGAWQSWKATGDDLWMRRALPRLAKALAYVERDPKHWDSRYQLVRRQHSCDTWDYDIDGAGEQGGTRNVVATCDQSGYYLAYLAMSRMYGALGDIDSSRKWEAKAKEYQARASKLLWDGTKFLHHYHIDKIDHGDFDESKQLAMGNTWAVTRGFANPGQAMSVIDEYRRRQKETGDAFPWWSLQPGYPDSLKYWKDPFRLQGGYANGGLMPWVGGELCRGAFQNGREDYGVELLRQYSEHLRKTGGAKVWYWPDGTPGFRTVNEVNYAGWGMAQWVQALEEGLAGIVDESAVLRDVEVSPRWLATGLKEAEASFRYAASEGYFSYQWKCGEKWQEISYSGSGNKLKLRMLVPRDAKAVKASLDGREVGYEIEMAGTSWYVCISAGARQGKARISY